MSFAQPKAGNIRKAAERTNAVRVALWWFKAAMRSFLLTMKPRMRPLVPAPSIRTPWFCAKRWFSRRERLECVFGERSDVALRLQKTRALCEIRIKDKKGVDRSGEDWKGGRGQCPEPTRSTPRCQSAYTPQKSVGATTAPYI